MPRPGAPPIETKGGSVDQALANGRKLLRTDPELALVQALTVLKSERGQNPEALRLAAAAHRKLGQYDQSGKAELAAIHFSQKIPALSAAAKALEEGRPGDASRIAANHLRATPNDLAAVSLSAESALALKLPEEAERLLRLVVDRAPDFIPATKLLISALLVQDKLMESRALLQRLVHQMPQDEESLRLLARVEADLGDYQAAILIHEQLLKVKSDTPEPWILYGDALRFSGRKVDSQLAYRRAVSLDPQVGQAWWSLVDLDPAKIEDDEIAEMEDILRQAEGRPEHCANLHFALGSALDAKRRYSDAFDHFERGNALVRSVQPYDPDDLTRQIDRSIECLSRELIRAPADPPTGDARPIFIVGMPRSGSTLVERILGRHSQIEALGELPLIPHIVETIKVSDAAVPLEQHIAALSSAQLGKFAERYRLRVAERRHSDAPFFTDKLHMNWRHLGLIFRMLPTAAVIDVRRSALDCCWSNYKIMFARGHPAAASLTDIGRMFVDYVRFMNYMDEVAPSRILRVSYEALIDDIEQQTLRILDYVGLPLETNCLEFHRSMEPVATASSEQVRQPLNRQGIGTWHPYDKWLDPLRTALGGLVGE